MSAGGVPSGLTVGIVGGGQLARMMALAGYPLGLRFVVLDPASDACAGQVAPQIHGEYDDTEALWRFITSADPERRGGLDLEARKFDVAHNGWSNKDVGPAVQPPPIMKALENRPATRPRASNGDNRIISARDDTVNMVDPAPPRDRNSSSCQ